MKNKATLVGALMAIATSTPVFAEASYVTVNLADGSKYSYLLSETPKISYSADSLLVKGSVSAGFEIKKVDSYNFTESDLSKTPVWKSNESRIVYLDNSQVKAEGVQPNSVVALYTSAGVAIQQTKANDEGVATLDLPQTKGVYILKTNSQSVKLVKE